MPPKKKKRKATKAKTAKKKASAVRKRSAAKAKRAKGASKKRAPARKRPRRAPVSSTRKRRVGVRSETQMTDWSRRGGVSATQSGDLQGLSRAERADSQSVDELVEEGNIVEAGAVAGVEQADSSDESEVHTHEVPEDDVPEEYLDEE
jgi:hypothetical protein